MITFENLSKRIFQFFSTIYAQNITNFGFSSVPSECFREMKWDQDIRPSVDFSGTNFVESDLSLSLFQTALVGSRTIDIYIRSVLGMTINDISSLTITELLNALNSILIIPDFYNNIDIQSFKLTPQIEKLLHQAQTGITLEIQALTRLNKMLLCSIYTIEIVTSNTYLTPINISTLLFYEINDEMRGNGRQSDTIYYNSSGLEVVDAIKDVEVIMCIFSKHYYSKDAINFFNFAIQSERGITACYDPSFDFSLEFRTKTQPRNLTALEKGAWTERIDQTLYLQYTDTLTLDEVYTLNDVSSIETVKDVYQYNLKIKEI